MASTVSLTAGMRSRDTASRAHGAVFAIRPPVLWLALSHVPPVVIAPSIDDEDVQSSKGLDRRMQHLLHRRQLRHVCWHSNGASTMGYDVAHRGGNVLRAPCHTAHRSSCPCVG